MRKSRLEVRSWEMVGLGYVVAPVFGLTTLWLIEMFVWASSPPTDWSKAPELWVLMVLVGVPVCAIVELIFVTPLLLWFRRFRWPWLNCWSGAAIGFVLGAGAWLTLGLLPSRDFDGLILIRVVREALAMGAVGLVTAIAFRFIAIKTASDPAQPTL